MSHSYLDKYKQYIKNSKIVAYLTQHQYTSNFHKINKQKSQNKQTKTLQMNDTKKC